MTTYNTGNPIGSTEVKDLYDNAQNFDTLANTTTLETVPDRLGVPRMTLHGFEQEAGRSIAAFEQSSSASLSSFEQDATWLIESIKFQPPIPYSPGIEVTTSSQTVEYLGVIYYALPSAIPFMTGAWNPAQWSPVQNTFPGNELLVFDNYIAASAAAATLPDGQVVVSEDDEVRGVVNSGAISQEQSIYKVADYAKIRNYTGRGTRLRVVDPTGAHWWVRRGSASDNGGTVLVDAQGRSWDREYSGAVQVAWFKSTPTTSDKDALQGALTIPNAEIDGGGKTISVDSALSPITVDGISLKNLTIDSSSSTDIAPILKPDGVRGELIITTADILAGSSTIQMTSTVGLTAGQYIYIGSNAYYSISQSSRIGQIVRIKTVDSSTQVTLHSPTLYSFFTANVAYVQPLTTRKNITFENLTFIGNPTSTVLQEAVRATTCEDFKAVNCHFRNYNYAGIRLDRSIGSRVLGGSAKDASGAGLSYGVAVTFGCLDTVVAFMRGDNLRHLVATGGNQGVNLYTQGVHNFATSMWDAGLDAHCNSDHTDYSHNRVELSAAVSKEGIICQGGSFTAIGNTTVGSKTKAILYESLTDGQEVAVNISGNVSDCAGGSGVYAYTYPGTTTNITTLKTDDNHVRGSAVLNHVVIYAQGGSIFNASARGNIAEFPALERSIYVRAANGAQIGRLSAHGNTAKSGTGFPVVYIFGDATSSIGDVNVSGNSLIGGDYSVYMNYVNGGYVGENMTSGYSVDQYRIDGTSQGVALDRSKSKITTYSSGGSYAVLPQDRYVIINRAASVTVTLPSAASNRGRELTIKTVQAFAVVSATANVVPIGGGAVGTAILPATVGSWALLVSDGADWVVMQKG